MDHVAKNKSIVRSKEVVGVKVLNTAKEDLGKIYDIVLDKKSGLVKYSVLESGSFLGLGGKYFAIPWQSLHYDPSLEAFILNVNKDDLQNAPGFDKDNWPVFSDPTWITTVDTYYSKCN